MSFPFFKNYSGEGLATPKRHQSRLRPNGLRRSEGGFTLLEMMVVISIMLVVTGILLANLPQFRDQTSLNLVAQDVASTIRSAQVFAIGTRVAANRFPSHGIFMCDPSTNTQCTKQFVLFSDDNNDTQYDGGSLPLNNTCGTDECRELYQLAGSISICKIQVKSANRVDSLLGNLNIVFSRLYASATIQDNNNDGQSDNSYDSVKITIRSAREKKERNIIVYNTGSIVVTNQEATPVCR